VRAGRGKKWWRKNKKQGNKMYEDKMGPEAIVLRRVRVDVGHSYHIEAFLKKKPRQNSGSTIDRNITRRNW
jgi:hypothetical protein